MSETTQRATAAQAETTPASIDRSEGQSRPQAASKSSLMTVISLIMRVVTLASLIVCLSVMVSNSKEIDSRTKIHFSDIYSYRYVVSTSAIGLAYTWLQSSLVIYQLASRKRMTNHHSLVIFEFIGDKVILCLLATGVGSGFGSTLDVKSKLDEFEDALEDYVGIGFPTLRAKLDDFMNKAYIPTIFLLIACLSCGVSSVLSSLALSKKAP